MKLLLLITLALPLLGAALMWVLAPLGRNIVRWSALAVTVAAFACACVLVANFPDDAAANELAVQQSPPTSVLLDVRFQVGLDGLSIWLFALSALLMLTSVLVSWEAIRDRAPLFYSMLLLLECGCLGVFAARDIMLFYVFFEFTLIPLFFLIGIWGSEQRRYAAIKFFLFTLAGSLLTFLGLLTIVIWDYSLPGHSVMRFSIPELTASLSHNTMSVTLQSWVFLALFAGFAIKVPLFPLHTWLPLAHVQAPTAGSVFLAGILLKIGTYGFLRFSIPMLPDATAVFMPGLLWLATAGIIYGALVALAQSDIKRLIAYSSVSHLGYCMLGLFALNPLGVQGGTLQMINHGISTGGLFALVGMMYERYHTREIRQFSGLARKLPWLAFFMLVFTFSSIGLPGTNGFAGEFLVLLGMFQRAFTQAPDLLQWQLRVLSVLALSGVILGAWYMLWMVQRVFFGPLVEPHPKHEPHSEQDSQQNCQPDSEQTQAPVLDLSWREILSLTPLAVFVVWIGLQPKFFLDRMAPTLGQLTAQAESAVRQTNGLEPQAPATSQSTSQPTAAHSSGAGSSGVPEAFRRTSPSHANERLTRVR